MKLRFIKWFASKLPSRTIMGSCGKTLGPLLVRYYLVDLPILGIYLHNLRRDDQRDLHDHPWPFVSLILNGGYIENSEMRLTDMSSFRYYPAGSILYRHATWKHRLEVDPETWTLVIKWRTRRDWGFWVQDGRGLRFVNWKDYDYGKGCE